MRRIIAIAVLVGCWSTADAQTVSQRGFVEIRGFGFAQAAPNDNQRVIADVLFREEVFARPARWIHLAAGADFRVNSHDQVDDEWRVDLEDRGVRRPRAAMRRLSASFAGGGFALDVGKQFIRWGRADIVNPTDRFAPRDFLNVVDPDFLPITAVRPSLQVGSETVEFVWMPWFTPSRLPLFGQRWAVAPGVGDLTVTDGGADIPSDPQMGFRWQHAGGRAEFSLSYFDGFNHLPNMEARLTEAGLQLTRVYPAIRTYGGDFAIPTGFATFKGEAAYFTPPTAASEEYVLYVVEIERQTGEWILAGGYVGEWVRRSGESLAFSPDRGVARSVVGRASYTVDPTRTVELEGAVRERADGWYVKGTYSQSWSQHWRLTLSGVGIAGEATDFFGQYERNSHGSVALRFSF